MNKKNENFNPIQILIKHGINSMEEAQFENFINLICNYNEKKHTREIIHDLLLNFIYRHGSFTKRISVSNTSSITNVESIEFFIENLKKISARLIKQAQVLQNEMLIESKEDVEPKFYTVAEIAKKLKVTNKTVYNYMDSGKLKFKKISERKRFISDNNLSEFLSSK